MRPLAKEQAPPPKVGAKPCQHTDVRLERGELPEMPPRPKDALVRPPAPKVEAKPCQQKDARLAKKLPKSRPPPPRGFISASQTTLKSKQVLVLLPLGIEQGLFSAPAA